MSRAREALDYFNAGVMDLPLHRRLGLSIVHDSQENRPRVVMPSQPALVGPDGSHPPATLFTVAEVCGGVQLADEVLPLVVGRGMGAVSLTITAHFRPLRPAYGAISGSAEVVTDLKVLETQGKPPRKAKFDTSSTLTAENGETVAEQKTTFYLRFMPPSRLRSFGHAYSGLVRILES